MAAVLAAAFLLPFPLPASPQIAPVPLDAFRRGFEESAAAKPRLVVALLIDQYRDDYLDRFRPAFGKDGFVRVLDGGARFRDCTIPYALTLTGPGHATWLSGTTPSVHGIVANEWYDQREKAELAAAGDPSVRSIGAEGSAGEPASPRWMKAETVADVLKSETEGEAKVIGISDKARGAILPTGKRPNGAYWLDENTGLMQTSSYYAERLPDWAVRANEARKESVAVARRAPWRRTLPAELHRATIELDPRDVFPHEIVERDSRIDSTSRISLTLHPVMLTTLFDFAEAAIRYESLGQDLTPDLLVVSVSITDRVGHRYGPDSPEVLELAHLLDARLARFMNALDRLVGEGGWALSITADHAVGPAPGALRRGPGTAAATDSIGGVPQSLTRRWVDRVLQRALSKGGDTRAAGVDSFALYAGSGMVTFDARKLHEAGVGRSKAARVVADSAASTPWFLTAFTAEDIRAGRPPGELGRQVIRSFQAGRTGDVLLVPRAYVWFGGPTFTFRVNHGSPYRYDAHVPFVLYGWGVRPGNYWEQVSTVDIAPTMSALLGIDPPAQNEGRALYEALTGRSATTGARAAAR